MEELYEVNYLRRNFESSFSLFRHVKGMHVNMWSHMTNPKYPILTHIVGAIAPSLVLPNKEERDNIFPMMDNLKMILESSGYFHIQGNNLFLNQQF